VIDEMLGAWRLQRPSSASRGVTIGKLVAMRVGDTGPFFLGMVSALVQETDGRIVATVTLFPGKPEPVAVRAGDARNRANAKWSEAFRLPELEKLKVPMTFVVPSGLAQRGPRHRHLDRWRREGIDGLRDRRARRRLRSHHDLLAPGPLPASPSSTNGRRPL
jgi:hypothetical protein